MIDRSNIKEALVTSPSIVAARAEQLVSDQEKKLLRRCLGSFATGVAIITTSFEQRHFGITVNSFSSVSLNPPVVQWSVGERSRCLEIFRRSNTFCINVLSDQQTEYSQVFASDRPDKFLDVRYKVGLFDMPVFDGAIAHIYCRYRDALAVGDHTLFFADVMNFAATDGNPLIFYGSRYRELI